MTDLTDIDQILPPAPTKARRSLARRGGPARNTETLGASLERVVDALGFPAEAGVTAASLELGLTLKQARLAKGLTQAQLAKRIGQSQTALSMIENGRGPDGPTWTTVARICEALDIEPSFLPAGARSTGMEDVEVRMVPASKGANAKVREADLGEAAVAVALSLLSKEAAKWLKTTLRKVRRGSIETSTDATGARFWSLAPHTGTRITADGPLVVIAADGGRVDVRAVALHDGAGKTFIHDGVALVDNAGAVEVGNTSNESSLVFAVPAAQLLDKEGAAPS